jgi:hypothetical protein
MPMKTLLAVLGHRGAEEVIKRHMEFWSTSGCDIWGFNPNQGMIWPDGVPSISWGEPGHCGEHALARLAFAMSSFCMLGYDQICMIEYDVLTFGKIPDYVSRYRLHGCLMPNHDPNYSCDPYATPPWIFDPLTGTHLAHEIQRLIDAGRHEGGHADRIISLAARNCRFTMYDIPEAVTWEFDRCPERCPEIRQRVRDGTVKFLHQIKTQGQIAYFTQ